ncbi:hypothetical protein [Bradyrhizobium sp. USDA 4486]
MAGDHAVVLIDEDRIGKAEFLDRGGDLLDLFFGMRAGIGRSGGEAGSVLIDDRELAMMRRTG